MLSRMALDKSVNEEDFMSFSSSFCTRLMKLNYSLKEHLLLIKIIAAVCGFFANVFVCASKSLCTLTAGGCTRMCVALQKEYGVKM